ncbi:MAG: hypothetical protein Q8941_21025 [Bacteroidota bacterium]|nr:hypothetical protein [Bacteroidota bacterium]
MVVTLQYNDLTIELVDDSAFTQSPDSPTLYDKVIQAEKDKAFSPSSQHAIKIYKNNIPTVSAIILGSGGATRVDSDTALIDDNNLIIRCSDKLFSLTLPNLETNWVTEADWATCFSIHTYKDTYISYGETSIARIDKTGKVIWSYSGMDIFICLSEGNPFEMHDTYIALTDFNGSTYQIDYDGKTISYSEASASKRPSPP